MAKQKRATPTGAAPTKSAVATPSILLAEAFGTFLLVFGGVGTALYASAFPTADNAVGVGYLGVALAFGLTVVVGIYAVGHLSGGHFNPAVTIGLAIAGRAPWKSVPAYIGAQLVGGLLASSALALIAANGPTALAQLWVFFVAPIVGAAIAGVAFRSISRSRQLIAN